MDSSISGRLASAYVTLAHGLTYPGSEADSPYQAFQVALDKDTELDADTFRTAVGIDPAWRISLIEDAAPFGSAIESATDPRAGNDPVAAATYTMLQQMMTAVSTATYIASARQPEGSWEFAETPHYFFGRLSGGDLAGLFVLSVET